MHRSPPAPLGALGALACAIGAPCLPVRAGSGPALGVRLGVRR